jgi:hypothetical protein
MFTPTRLNVRYVPAFRGTAIEGLGRTPRLGSGLKTASGDHGSVAVTC